MKTPVVDYKKLRFSNIASSEYKHLLLLLGWIVYFALYFLTEKLIPADNCYIMHSKLDDIIPFCEFFVIPYVGWYFLVAGSLLYFALYNIESFKNLQKYIIITQVVAMAIYIAFPNMQDLRPEVFPRDNILSRCVGFLYYFDTNTNVFPSLHVAYSIALASVWLKEKKSHLLWRAFVVVAVILICLSTAFIKQHSVLDIFGAFAVCVLAEIIVYGKYWYNCCKSQKELYVRR